MPLIGARSIGSKGYGMLVNASGVDPNFSSVVLLLHGDGTNGSQTIVDSSSNAVSVTAVSAAQLSTLNRRFGISSISFDGSSRLQIANNASYAIANGSGTIELWVYPTAQDSFRRIMTSTGADFTAGNFIMRYNNGTFIAGDTGSGYITVGSIPTTINTWNHIAWVGVGGTTQTLYVNGTNVGTAGAYNINSIQTIGGYRSSTNTEYYSGYIDEMRITKGVARYTADFTPSNAPFSNI